MSNNATQPQMQNQDPLLPTNDDQELDRLLLWTYRAKPDPSSDYAEGVVDADTLDLCLDLGFSTRASPRVRIRHIDTAEVYGVKKDSQEYQLGMAQAQFVANWLTTAVDQSNFDWPLLVTTDKDETGKYGRYLATITRRCDGASLISDLTDEWPEVVNG